MQGPLYFGLAFTMLILENLWRAQWPIHGLAPQFTLLLVAFMGLTEHGLAGLFYAFGLGIAMDALAGTVPGFTAVAYIITYVFMIAASKLFWVKSIPFQILTAAVMTSLAVTSRLAILWFYRLERGLGPEILRDIPWQILLNLVAVLLLFPILIRLDEATDPGREGELFSSVRW